MKKLIALLFLIPTLAVAQTQITGSAVQIGGGVPNVTSIEGLSGDFIFTGTGFQDCVVTGDTKTCTFNGGSNNNYTGQCNVGLVGLVGAYTDNSGVFKQALCIGAGPSSFTVPTGATQLLLGVDDQQFADNTGSFTVSVSVNGAAATNYTVGGTAEPWDPVLNPTYDYGRHDGASATVGATGLSAGDTVTITYVGGTVNAHSGTYPDVDANGYLTNPPGAAGLGGPTGTALISGYYTPTKYMTLGGGTGVTSINSRTGDMTFTGSGVSQSGNTFTFNGAGTPGGSSGQLQYNNAGAFGGDTSTTDGAGNLTARSYTANGTGAGSFTAAAGTAPTGAAGKAIYTSDASVGYAEVNENNTGLSRICTAANGQCAGTTPVTTKGDLYGFSTVPARVPVGTDGQVLTADSTQALGVKWATGGGGGSGSPGTPAGTLQAYKTSTTFGGTTTWIAAAGYNGMACDGTTDDTTAFNALLSTVYTAGGGTIHVSGTCLLSGQINLPNDGATTNPSQPTIRITGDGGGGSGAWQTPFLAPPATSGTLDLRVTATYGKILTLGVGKLEIDHLVLKDGGTDCTAFVYTTNTTLELHDNLFTGTASGTSACNDAVILGGTTTVYGGNTATAAFQGYNTYINHNFFDKIRRGVYFREAANAVVVRDNTFSKTCGATSSEAAIEVGYAGFGQVQSNVFSGNLFEVTNYPYVYKVWDDNNQWFGDTFWDGTGTLLDLFNFGAAAGNNTAFISHDASITQAKLSNSSLINGTSNNSVLDQNAQLELGAAAALGRTCADSSGSGTAQSCSTYVTYTPQAGAWIIYTTTTANTGTGLTINVNGGGIKSVYKCAGTTATLAVGDIPANKPIPMFLDAAGHWNATSTTTGCTSYVNPMTTLGDTIYGGASGAQTRLAGPATAASHQYLFGELGGATTPAWFDLGATVGTYVKATSPIVATQNANDVTLSCPTCGTSSATNVTINGGTGLGTANLNDTTPAAPTNGINVKWASSASDVSAAIVGDGNAAHFLNGTGTFTAPAGGSGAWTNITGSAQITATGCTQSASTGGNCAVSGSTTTAVTFSVIPGTYSNLELVFWGRSSAGGNGKITLNSDTGNNYVLNGYFQSATSVSQNAIYSTNGCGVVATVASGIVGYSIVTIPFYADTSFGKYLSVRDGGGTGVTSGNPVDSTGSCGWNSTAAITSITVTLPSGNFTAGSKFQIYAQN